VNILSKYEREQRRERTADAAAQDRDRRYISGDAAAVEAERRGERGRRYAAILLAVRTVHGDWPIEAVRSEAQRLMLVEDPSCPSTVWRR
jgi:hypothetical protein